MTAGSSVPEAARAAATETLLAHMGDIERWSETVGRALEAAAPHIVAAAVAEERATTGRADEEARLWLLVESLDERIDDGAGPDYHAQPLAQDWARVAKVQEEAGEAVDALIGVTAQNHRKGQYGSMADLFDELADVAMTGVYAIQHFTKDRDETRRIILDRADKHASRVGVEVSIPATVRAALASPGERCSTCDQPLDSPGCSVGPDRTPAHTVGGGCQAAAAGEGA